MDGSTSLCDYSEEEYSQGEDNDYFSEDETEEHFYEEDDEYDSSEFEYHRKRKDLAQRILSTKVRLLKEKIQKQNHSVSMESYQSHFIGMEPHSNRPAMHHFRQSLTAMEDLSASEFRTAAEEYGHMLSVVQAVSTRIDEHVANIKEESLISRIEKKIEKTTKSMADGLYAKQITQSQFLRSEDEYFRRDRERNREQDLNTIEANRKLSENHSPSLENIPEKTKNLNVQTRSDLNVRESSETSQSTTSKINDTTNEQSSMKSSMSNNQSIISKANEANKETEATKPLEANVAEEELDIWEKIMTKDASIFELGDDDEKDGSKTSTEKSDIQGNKSKIKNKVISMEMLKPRYRWIKEGKDIPSDEKMLMKGRTLFRAIASTIVAIKRMQFLALAEKKALFSVECEDMAEQTKFYESKTTGWLLKVIRQPISDITTKGAKLQLDPDKANHHGKSITSFFRKPKEEEEKEELKRVCMKLKVRLKAILESLVKVVEEGGQQVPMPNGLLMFLRRLISDGCAFPKGFLFEEERNLLDFSIAGFTKQMIPKGPSSEFDFKRPIMVLTNFVVKRCLIPAALEPWNYSTAIPKGKFCQNNLVVVSTFIYAFAQNLVGGPLPGEKDKKQDKRHHLVPNLHIDDIKIAKNLGKLGHDLFKKKAPNSGRDNKKNRLLSRIKKNKVEDVPETVDTELSDVQKEKEEKSSDKEDDQVKGSENEYLTSYDVSSRLHSHEVLSKYEDINFMDHFGILFKLFMVLLLKEVIKSDSNHQPDMISALETDINTIEASLEELSKPGGSKKALVGNDVVVSSKVDALTKVEKTNIQKLDSKKSDLDSSSKSKDIQDRIEINEENSLDGDKKKGEEKVEEPLAVNPTEEEVRTMTSQKEAESNSIANENIKENMHEKEQPDQQTNDELEKQSASSVVTTSSRRSKASRISQASKRSKASRISQTSKRSKASRISQTSKRSKASRSSRASNKISKSIRSKDSKLNNVESMEQLGTILETSPSSENLKNNENAETQSVLSTLSKDAEKRKENQKESQETGGKTKSEQI